MAASSRDRISVDLNGMRAVLFEQARARGTSPSRLVRDALADLLRRPKESGNEHVPASASQAMARMRLTIRMSRADAVATQMAAGQAGLPLGAFIAGLAAAVPVLSEGSGLAEHATALRLSCGEMSTLSRNMKLDLTLLHGRLGT